MRGIYLPDSKVIDLECINLDLPDNAFIQQIALGTSACPQAHLIVPTLFGFILDEYRDHIFRVAVSLCQTTYTPHILSVIERADRILMHQCSSCGSTLPLHSRKSLQLALHLVGGIIPRNADTFEYEVLWGLLCRKCETTCWRNTCIVDDARYIAMSRVVREYTMTKRVSLESFLTLSNGDYTKAVADMYTWRFAETNARTREFVRAVQSNDGSVPLCYHCGKSGATLPIPCSDCGAIFFCGHGECSKRGAVYHAPLCVKIRERALFDVDKVMLLST